MYELCVELYSSSYAVPARFTFSDIPAAISLPAAKEINVAPTAQVSRAVFLRVIMSHLLVALIRLERDCVSHFERLNTLCRIARHLVAGLKLLLVPSGCFDLIASNVLIFAKLWAESLGWYASTFAALRGAASESSTSI
jgi:hypothetical protein